MNGIRPLRVFAGVALLGVAVLTIGAAQAQKGDATRLNPPARPVSPIEVFGIPNPTRVVEIKGEVGGYIVPPGKLFVLTALGQLGCSSSASIAIALDGQGTVTFPAVTPSGNGPGIQMQPIPHPTIIFQGGDNVVVWGGCGSPPRPRAWGYLVDAKTP